MKLDTIKIRSEMWKRNISQTVMSKSIHMFRPGLNRILQGGGCTYESAFKIAKALGIPIMDLILEDDND